MSDNYEMIHNDHNNTGNAWVYTEYRVYPHGPRRRVQVKRDCYDAQSFAKVEQWSETNGWLTVLSMPIHAVPAGKVSYVAKRETFGSEFHDSATYLFYKAHILLDEA